MPLSCRRVRIGLEHLHSLLGTAFSVRHGCLQLVPYTFSVSRWLVGWFGLAGGVGRSGARRVTADQAYMLLMMSMLGPRCQSYQPCDLMPGVYLSDMTAFSDVLQMV